MKLADARVIIHRNGIPREIFRIVEVEAGDVYVSLVPTEESDDTPPLSIIERRFSVHASDKSPEFNMLKFTSKLKGVEIDKTTVQLTDAIKSQVNFAPIAVIKLSDLSADQYDFVDNGLATLDFGNFDPIFTFPVVGIFVGHRDVPFAYNLPMRRIQTRLFNIVFLFNLYEFPATQNSHIKTRKTFPPELQNTEDGKISMRSMMSGQTVEQCVFFFNAMANDLFANHIEQNLQIIPIPEMKTHYERLLQTLRAIIPQTYSDAAR
jgi:hypothetical protein